MKKPKITLLLLSLILLNSCGFDPYERRGERSVSLASADVFEKSIAIDTLSTDTDSLVVRVFYEAKWWDWEPVYVDILQIEKKDTVKLYLLPIK